MTDPVFPSLDAAAETPRPCARLPYVSPMPHVYPWAPTQISDRAYEVTTARFEGREISLGDIYGYGLPVTRIWFYTGFAGCPPRYYIATDKQTVIATV